MNINIHINSKNHLADSPFNITVTGLEKQKKYKLSLTISNYLCINAPMTLSHEIDWHSSIKCYSNQDGVIDLNQVESMGLFFNARPEKKSKNKLPKKLDQIPLYSNYHIILKLILDNKILATKKIDKFYMEESIRYKNISAKHFQGRLFYNKNLQKSPALIIVSGSDGRIEKAQTIAQLLSSRGYTCLAVAYFGLEGLPKYLERIPIELIKEAKDYLTVLPYVDSTKIGIYGRSKGAELVLASESLSPMFQCIALNSPSNIIFEGIKGRLNSKSSSWTYHGEELNYHPFSYKDFLLKIFYHQEMPVGKLGRIDISKIKAPLLLLASQNDEIWRAKNATKDIIQTYQGPSLEFEFYQETGHMLTIAYQPNPRYKGNWKLLMEESVDSWNKTIRFFDKHLKSENKIKRNSH